MPFGLFLIMMTEAPARGTWETKLGKIQDRLDEAPWQTERMPRHAGLTAITQSLVPFQCSHHASCLGRNADGAKHARL